MSQSNAKRSSALLLLAFVLLNALTYAQSQLTGRVLSREGVPQRGAEVNFYPFGPTQGIRMGATTDARGQFSFETPYQGLGFISASKIEDGYPDAAVAFFNPKHFESIQEIDTSRPRNEPLTLTFGEPLPRLKLSFSAASGSLPPVQIRVVSNVRPSVVSAFSRPADEDWEFVIPPDPVTITVSAAGYNPWRYKSEPGRYTNGVVWLKVKLTPLN